MTTFNFFSIVDLLAVQIGNGSTKSSTKVWIVNSAKSDKEGDEEQNKDDEDRDNHKEGDFVAKYAFMITGRHNILHKLEGNNDGMCIVCTADYQVLELAS